MVGKDKKQFNRSLVSKVWSCHELAHLMYDIWDIRASVMERGDPSYQRASVQSGITYESPSFGVSRSFGPISVSVILLYVNLACQRRLESATLEHSQSVT